MCNYIRRDRGVSAEELVTIGLNERKLNLILHPDDSRGPILSFLLCDWENGSEKVRFLNVLNLERVK